MAFEICRFWQKGPLWFYGLPKNLQIRLIADYRLYHAPDKPKKKSITPEELRKSLKKFENRGIDYDNQTKI